MKKFTEYLKKYFDKKEITLGLLIFAMVFVILGSTFAYWRWNSTIEQRTNITFTANPAFTCSVNGGGDITSSDIQLQPTTCTDSEHIIKRKIKYSRDITQRDLNVSYILNLKVSEIGEGLANSDNFRYALTSSESSCDTDVISSGKVQDDALLIKTSYSSSGYEEAYLWIWLDAEEEDPSTMNQEFKATLGGTCEIKPEGPMLVDGKTFNNLVFTELGNVYSEKTGMDTFYPNIVTVYSNGNLPYGISKETLETYANIDISSKKNGSVKAYYNYNEQDDIGNVYIYSDEQIYSNTDSSGMFSMSHANSLYLSELDTSKVIYMAVMFADSSIDALDLSNFDTSNVVNMEVMFANSSIDALDLSNFDTSNVVNMEGMFIEFQTTILDISNMNIGNYNGNFENMFSPNYNLTKIIVKDKASKQFLIDNFEIERNIITYDGEPFSAPGMLVDGKTFNRLVFTELEKKYKEETGKSDFRINNFYTHMSWFPVETYVSVDVSSFQDNSIRAYYIDGNIYLYSENEIFANEDSSNMFENVAISNQLAMYYLNVSKVKNASKMFYNSQIDDISFDFHNYALLEDVSYMFQNCKARIIELFFDFEGYEGKYTEMFSNNPNLSKIYIDGEYNQIFISTKFNIDRNMIDRIPE